MKLSVMVAGWYGGGIMLLVLSAPNPSLNRGSAEKSPCQSLCLFAQSGGRGTAEQRWKFMFLNLKLKLNPNEKVQGELGEWFEGHNCRRWRQPILIRCHGKSIAGLLALN